MPVTKAAKGRRGGGQTAAATAKTTKSDVPPPKKVKKVVEEQEEEAEDVVMEEVVSDQDEAMPEPEPEEASASTNANATNGPKVKAATVAESKRKKNDDSPTEIETNSKSRKKLRVEPTKVKANTTMPATADSNNNRTLNASKARSRGRPSLSASVNTSKGRGSTRTKLQIQPSPILSGKVYTFGTNDDGQLGIVTASGERKFPALVVTLEGIPMTQVCGGSLHTLALSAKGQVYSFGCNDERALGRDADAKDDDNPTQGIPGLMEIPQDQRVVQITAGDCHSALLTEYGQVFACGLFRSEDGTRYGLINGHEEKVPVPTPQRVYPYPDEHAKIVKIASGINHIVLLSEDGVVYSCGDNELGQLGREFITRVTRRTAAQSSNEINLKPMKVSMKKKVVDIWAGGNMTYMKTDGGEMWACGLNSCGQLGVAQRNPTEMCVALPRRANAFDGKDWKQLAPGKSHTLAVDVNGKAYGLGFAREGQLGLGDAAPPHPFNVLVPTVIPIPDSDKLKCLQVAAGNESSLAIMEDFKLYAWGYGDNCQLGNGTSDTRYVPTLCNGKVRETGINGKVIFAAVGFQHSTIIVQPNAESESS